MTERHPADSAPSQGKWLLRAAILLFAAFFANLLAGKGNVSFKWGLPHLGHVAEFILLAAASTVLILAALRREWAEKKTSNQEVKED